MAVGAPRSWCHTSCLALALKVFEDRQYERHGIRLDEGGVVLDVGANIGLFSLHAAQQLGPEGLVLAAEPIPALHAALASNAARLASSAQACAPIRPLPLGVGDGSVRQTTFRYYRQASGWSSMLPAEDEVKQEGIDRMPMRADANLLPPASKQVLGSMDRYLSSASAQKDLGAAAWLLRLLPQQLRRWVGRSVVERKTAACLTPYPTCSSVVRWFVQRMLSDHEDVSCRQGVLTLTQCAGERRHVAPHLPGWPP